MRSKTAALLAFVCAAAAPAAPLGSASAEEAVAGQPGGGPLVPPEVPAPLVVRPVVPAVPWQLDATERERRPVVRVLGLDVTLMPVERRLVYVPVESRSYDGVLLGAEVMLPWRLP